ncbi:MAG: restriction endonuclease [Chthoniobacter sp.]|nr:restriction endonuclease [Chthoniobacter sp.]
MAIPKYHEMMLPLLRFLADGNEHSQRDLAEPLCNHFGLTVEERSKELPSRQTTYVRHRLGWAGFSLRRSGLAEMPRTGTLRIAEEGKKFLATNPARLTRNDLKQFPAWVAFLAESKKSRESTPTSGETDEEKDTYTPEEVMENASDVLRAQLALDLLARMRASDPIFFERLVMDLLLKMGYGGSREEAAQATKASGDGGIDGVINEDRLGLDAVYVQAKRWENSVGEPQLRDFVGALHAHRASKGVFMTTSEFTTSAKAYVDKVQFKISLIDGRRLADLMIDFGVGVSLAHTYEIKKIDSDYFEEA